MLPKRILIGVVTFLVLIGGVAVGVFLVRQTQDFREKAATATGQATVTIAPSSGTYQVGSTIELELSFNTAGVAVSAIATRLNYPYSGNSPEISVESIQANPVLIASAEWTCPVETNTLQGGNVTIDIACANLSVDGFISSGSTLLSTITLKVNSAPASNPTIVAFEPAQSVITRKSDGDDVLLVPISTATLNITGGQEPTSTPTPTGAQGGGSATSTPTQAFGDVEELPDSGFDLPTILGVGAGIIIVVSSLLLAL